jgi:hypothetical protein
MLLFFSERLSMIVDVVPLLTQARRGIMFADDTTFIVHAEDQPCQQQEDEEETYPVEHLEELLDGFPWGKKAKRLLHCIVPQLSSIPDDYAIIDLLKFCCTPDNKFNQTDDPHRRKIMATLKKYKSDGINIPQAFLTKPVVKKMF